MYVFIMAHNIFDILSFTNIVAFIILDIKLIYFNLKNVYELIK